jgi:poly(3-hydroxyalkanoate) synthetase
LIDLFWKTNKEEMPKKIAKEPELITAGSAADWRKWLQKNHQEEDNVWLV